jgi:hypothetical protein
MMFVCLDGYLGVLEWMLGVWFDVWMNVLEFEAQNKIRQISLNLKHKIK